MPSPHTFSPNFPFPSVERMPTEINPCTIVDTVLEVQLSLAIDWAMVPGLAYNALKERFPQLNVLAVNYLPPEIRVQQPELGKQPHLEFKMDDESYMVRLGPNMASLNLLGTYPGWTAVFDQFKWVAEKLHETGIFKGPAHRLGLRMVDFFKEDVMHEFKIQPMREGQPISTKSSQVILEAQQGSFDTRVQIIGKASLKKKNEIVFTGGSVIDVDVSTHVDHHDFASCQEWFKKAHQLQKQIFFGLFTDDLLLRYNPTYCS